MASLSTQYAEAQKQYQAIEDTELNQADPRLQDQILQLLQLLGTCQDQADKAGLFSKNDELDDVHSNDLKYLLIPYYTGDLLIKVVDKIHLEHLLEAKRDLTLFMNKCLLVGVLSESEMEKLMETKVFDRQARIDRHRKEKEVAAKLADLNQRKKKLAKGKSEEELEGEYDELEREYQILTIEQAVRKSADKLNMTNKEIELLQLSQEQKQEAVEERRQEQEERAKNPQEPVMIVPENLAAREAVLKDMWNPKNLPTMTMEQYMAQNPHEFQPQQSAPPPQEEEEPDSDQDEDAIYKKREWDDWKDDHPRGWGNRKGNLG